MPFFDFSDFSCPVWGTPFVCSNDSGFGNVASLFHQGEERAFENALRGLIGSFCLPFGHYYCNVNARSQSCENMYKVVSFFRGEGLGLGSA